MDASDGAGDLQLDTDSTAVGPPARRWPWLLLVALIIAAAGSWWYFDGRQPAPPPEAGRRSQPPLVTVATAETSALPIRLQALGTVTPRATVTVRSRIEGQLQEIAFREGQYVKRGDFLALIDPRPYRAALDQAQGQSARDEAQLRNAEVDLARFRALVAADSIARQQLDTQEALVRQLRATLRVNQAIVDNAKLNLEYCRIEAPIDGRVGLRLVDEGNYVRAGDAGGIVVITQMQPITVVFSIPQDDLPAVLARMRGGAKLPVEAYDRAGATRLATGVLATVDNQIDPATGTIRLRALFDNADEQLFPNQFVNVRLLIDTLAAVTVVPASAVLRGAQGNYVYVLRDDETVWVRPVTPGVVDGERIQIKDGLAIGERVVTAGVDRLRDGIKVNLPAPSPAADAPAKRSGG